MFTQGDDLLPCPLPPRPIVIERRWKPNVELAPNCPRCHSSNTKFCYYNNYSLTQPRYFCKSCRRYWTKGGLLRNVPIGGGCRKNRRAKSAPVSIGSSRSGLHSNDSFMRSSDESAMASSNPSTSDSSSSIDLALVYAKFLDQRPDPNPETEMLELPREFELPGVSDDNPDSHAQFSNELVGCNGTGEHLSEGQQVLFSEFAGLEDTNSLALQPLPQPDVMGIQDMFWSNSPAVGSNFSWQGTTQLQGYEPVHDDHSTIHSNPLDDNWNSFDLPNFEAFSRP